MSGHEVGNGVRTRTIITMGDATVVGAKWRLVELGRVVLLQGNGPYAGRLATIVEIIDHKRALVDGPATEANPGGVPRQSISFSDVLLTGIVVHQLTLSARSGAVKRAWEAAKVDEQWKASNWYKKRVQNERRKALTDFDRFKVMRLKKQRRFEEGKALAKIKASA
ncbi:ribosomal protein l14 [Grosmannia clavigera kw1407]|uniref:Ribosomal protein l14 n=1 Tax=Grosmannia clavigera (strain kw1407 / UAMH 11150) TaxID=655863 RepID=F0XTA2_GROCL|nr:ribosomal protein l14 [Grosmannia clavigera kw1407]EFW99226.1 ribosomal protein l14 [Grosmannia clavigera kw1407]